MSRIKWMGVGGGVLVGVLSVVVLLAAQKKPITSLELIADDLEFRGENPTLSVRTGSRVRLLFRNEADGVIHQLTIEELGIESPVLQPGTMEEICFPAPSEERVLTYVCKLHPIMRGRIVVHRGEP